MEPGRPFSTIFDRPVYVSAFLSSALGAVGDVILVDPTQYYVGLEAAGVTTAVSLDFYFDKDIQNVKFTFRMDGASAWTGKADADQTPFAVIAARS